MPVILVVDDMPSNLEVLGALLQDKYEVVIATSGQQALAVAAEQKPDLILLDILLPDLDGYTVCARLKQQPATAAIPVIFVTVKSELDDVIHGFEVGGVDYLIKPFRAPEVLTRVRTHLELKQTRDRLEQAVGELSQALANVKQLSGLLPICSFCKKVRDDHGYWEQVEAFVTSHSEARFTHGICPECVEKNFPE